jgi:hypothetical protein
LRAATEESQAIDCLARIAVCLFSLLVALAAVILAKFDTDAGPWLAFFEGTPHFAFGDDMPLTAVRRLLKGTGANPDSCVLLCDRDLAYSILRRRRAGTPRLQATIDQMIIEPGSGAATSTTLSTLAEATTAAAKVKVVVPEIVYGIPAPEICAVTTLPVVEPAGIVCIGVEVPAAVP